MSLRMVERRRSDSGRKRQVKTPAFMRRPGSDPCMSGSDMAALRGNQGSYKGNGFFASAARTCDVTHTGVVAYCAE
jgi:hypothetical protein